MKRQLKFLTIPINIWTHPDLSVFERVVLIEIDSYCTSDMGVQIGAQTIASSIGLPVKTVKETLKTLLSKGAIALNIGENGEKLIKPYLYKDRYVTDQSKIEIGDKPTDLAIERIDYDGIADKWAEILPDMPQISRWTPQRKRKLKTIMKQAGISTDDLYKSFRIIAATPFLRGENDRKWTAGFNWILGNSNNVLKILEGTYSKSVMERREYEAIMNKCEQNESPDDSFYR